MCYPDRSPNGKCIDNSFTVCKMRDFSVHVILGRGVCPRPCLPRQAGLGCLLWERGGGGIRSTMSHRTTEHCGGDCEPRGWCMVCTPGGRLDTVTWLWGEWGVHLHGRMWGLWSPGYLVAAGDCHHSMLRMDVLDCGGISWFSRLNV